jgi:signal transduction histidine kinase
VERELARARAGARAAGSARHASPASVAEQVLAVLRRTPRGQALDWEVDIPESLVVEADPQDLAEMLGNLAENAAKWAEERVRITGRVADGPRGGVALAVEDDGPGIPEGEAETALARGGRLDATKPGTGLGLAIVGDLVEAYGGALTLSHSPQLGGLKAELRLPGVLKEPASGR